MKMEKFCEKINLDRLLPAFDIPPFPDEDDYRKIYIYQGGKCIATGIYSGIPQLLDGFPEIAKTKGNITAHYAKVLLEKAGHTVGVEGCGKEYANTIAEWKELRDKKMERLLLKICGVNYLGIKIKDEIMAIWKILVRQYASPDLTDGNVELRSLCYEFIKWCSWIEESLEYIET